MHHKQSMIMTSPRFSSRITVEARGLCLLYMDILVIEYFEYLLQPMLLNCRGGFVGKQWSHSFWSELKECIIRLSLRNSILASTFRSVHLVQIDNTLVSISS